MIFCHFHNGSAAAGGFPFDLVDKIMHKQNAATRCFEQILRIGRVGNFGDVEAFAEIANQNFQDLAVTEKRNFDLFACVELVAVFDGVRQGFAHRHVDAENSVVGKARFGRKTGRFLHRFVNCFYFARNGKFYFFFAHRSPIKFRVFLQ